MSDRAAQQQKEREALRQRQLFNSLRWKIYVINSIARKVLRLEIQNNLKWNNRVDATVTIATKRF